ncbi:uncharacterized protein LY79DRAFT_255593 [Colletotrichum navitas]|uniref:Uncharacterized protein n=1 Tax=Colletotrichum navitas TaxID=681940 RepID=A0AAD8QCZ0_9PEZI|nr:uncharacterized protein LY79DRAFT_255593 [Colletotrichum navitas]KAK1598754.1 hypothetical protein LY79DRAFT_255593 [Colletotrichum navitas]
MAKRAESAGANSKSQFAVSVILLTTHMPVPLLSVIVIYFLFFGSISRLQGLVVCTRTYPEPWVFYPSTRPLPLLSRQCSQCEPSVRIRQHNTIGNWETREATSSRKDLLPSMSAKASCTDIHHTSIPHLIHCPCRRPRLRLASRSCCCFIAPRCAPPSIHRSSRSFDGSVENASRTRPGVIRYARYALYRTLHYPSVHPAYPSHCAT